MAIPNAGQQKDATQKIISLNEIVRVSVAFIWNTRQPLAFVSKSCMKRSNHISALNHHIESEASHVINCSTTCYSTASTQDRFFLPMSPAEATTGLPPWGCGRTCCERMFLHHAELFRDLRRSQLLSRDRSSVWIRAVSSCKYEIHSVAVHEKCTHKRYGEEVHSRGHCGLKHRCRRTAASSLQLSNARNLPF